MVLVGLLLVALGCLVVGIVLASSAWLVACLLATAGAAYLVWKMRLSRTASTAPRPGAHTAAAHPAAVPPPADPETSPVQSVRADGSPPRVAAALAGQVWVVDGRPLYHRPDCALIKDLSAEAIPVVQATEDGFLRCSLCEPISARIG